MKKHTLAPGKAKVSRSAVKVVSRYKIYRKYSFSVTFSNTVTLLMLLTLQRSLIL